MPGVKVIMNGMVTTEKVVKAMHKVKCGKVLGVDVITDEILKKKKRG